VDPETVKEYLEILRNIGIPVVLALFLVYVLLFPEKAEKVTAWLWKGLSKMPRVFRTAHKRYLKHDLQGRLGDFTRKLAKDAPYLEQVKPKLEWVEPGMDREAFLKGDKLILRLRRDDRHDDNFVHGSYLYVSTQLLPKTKRYLAPSHRDAIDLFVTGKLLQKERPHIVGYFLDQYAHPKTDDADAKVGAYFDSFQKMDEAGLFFGVMMQEMYFLGLKVFGRRRDDRIIIEVNSLIEFLEEVASRKVGEEHDQPGVSWEYCCFAIVIVGKGFKLTPEGEVWVKYIRRELIPKEVDTIYLLGADENRDVIGSVAEQISESYEEVRNEVRVTPLRFDDRVEKHRQYLLVMRRIGVEIFKAS